VDFDRRTDHFMRNVIEWHIGEHTNERSKWLTIPNLAVRSEIGTRRMQILQRVESQPNEVIPTNVFRDLRFSL
jgi:hypothetical protein